MNEFRAALQEIVTAFYAQENVSPKELQKRIEAADALLARPEPQDDLLSAINHGIGQAILKADSGPGSVSLPQNMSEHIAAAVRERWRIESQPEPRITREDVQGVDFGESKEWMMDTSANKRTHAEKLLQRFAAQCIAVQGDGSLEALHAAHEACLAAMLRSEPVEIKKGQHAPLYQDVLVFDGKHWGIGSYQGHGNYSHTRYPVAGQCKATHWMQLPIRRRKLRS